MLCPRVAPSAVSRWYSPRATSSGLFSLGWPGPWLERVLVRKRSLRTSTGDTPPTWRMANTRLRPVIRRSVGRGQTDRLTADKGRAQVGVSCPRVSIKKSKLGTSRVAWWLRIQLPRQKTRVRALIWEDSTCRGATTPMCHTTTCARVQHVLKSKSLELVLRNKRSHYNEKPPNCSRGTGSRN